MPNRCGVEMDFVDGVGAVGVDTLVQHLYRENRAVGIFVRRDDLARDGAEPILHVGQVIRIHRRRRLREAPARGRRFALHVDANTDRWIVLRQHVIGQRTKACLGVNVGPGLGNAVHAALANEADEFQHVGAIVQLASEIVTSARAQRIGRRMMPPGNIERHDVDVHLLEIVQLLGPIASLVAIVGVVGRPDEGSLAVDNEGAVFDLYARTHRSFLHPKGGYYAPARDEIKDIITGNNR